jgi:hypothetical protein
MTQHLCEVALDYQNGIFSGKDKVIAEVTGQAPMTVQKFVKQHREAFAQPRHEIRASAVRKAREQERS